MWVVLLSVEVILNPIFTKGNQYYLNFVVFSKGMCMDLTQEAMIAHAGISTI